MKMFSLLKGDQRLLPLRHSERGRSPDEQNPDYDEPEGAWKTDVLAVLLIFVVASAATLFLW